MNIKTSEVSQVGLVLGIVWLIIGFNYDNYGLMIIGTIVFSMGMFFKFKKVDVAKVSNNLTKSTHKVKL